MTSRFSRTALIKKRLGSEFTSILERALIITGLEKATFLKNGFSIKISLSFFINLSMNSGCFLLSKLIIFQYFSAFIPLLDALVRVNSNRISITLYTKLTDGHCYLNSNICNPIHLEESIIYIQCLRIKCICSRRRDYQTHVGQSLS